MSTTYPQAPARTSNGTTIEIHHIMQTPALLARRILELASQRYVADFLLTGRYKVAGGAVMFETGTRSSPKTIPKPLRRGRLPVHEKRDRRNRHREDHQVGTGRSRHG
ncbi:hypothetical protein AHiyo4_07660 [Arthrobacter sp. Hiyo4]|nr:hypothetical protein AHiyo4_07660 [Arthrobacter sp. Hiyo4]